MDFTEFIQFYNVQQELRDHYRYSSRMNSQMSVVMVTVGQECSRHGVQDVGELSCTGS